jgi:DNA-3-methyladenine glycosylase II
MTFDMDSSRRIRTTQRKAFLLYPAPPFRLDLAAWTLRRRPNNVIDRWDGQVYRRVLVLPNGPVEIAVVQTAPPETPQIQVTVRGAVPGTRAKTMVSSAVERLLGIHIELAPFYRFALRQPKLAQLVPRFHGMKPPRFLTIYEALVNAFACQQLSLSLGIILLNRLAEAYGLAVKNDSAVNHAFPRPEDLADVKVESLRTLGFSRQKAQAIIQLSRAVCHDKLDLEALANATHASAMDRLLVLRGVGRWSAEYTLLRGFGRLNVFPGDDLGFQNNLAQWLKVKKTPDYEGVHRMLHKWQKYGGLIYFHMLLDRLAEKRYFQ